MNTIDNLFEGLNKKPITFKEKIMELGYDLQYVFDTYIKDIYHGIKNYIRNIIRYSSILWNDHDWDFDFFLNIQDKKLVFMEKYHRHSGISTDNLWIADKIKLAKNLLEVSRSIDSDKHEELYWTPYVNTRNARRFHDNWDTLLKIVGEKPLGKQMALYDLRMKKAWYLYNKLLFLYIHHWWD